MVRVQANKEMPHLFAGLIALGLAAAVLFGGQMVVIHLEHSTIPSTAPDLFLLKNQGLAFQRAAARAADVFPTFPRWRRRREHTHHAAKSRRPWIRLTRQEACHLPFAGLVLDA